MRFQTGKFGCLEIDNTRILLFPDGILGFETQRHWVLLAENDSDSIGWLQSLTCPQLALLVVTPQRFVPEYELHIHPQQLESLPWSREDRALAVAIVSENHGHLTVNLKAPLLINVDRCLGRQVLVSDDQPLQFPLTKHSSSLRKSA